MPFCEWTDLDNAMAIEGEATKFAFRSATRVGRGYRKPRGKNGGSLGQRGKQDRLRTSGPLGGIAAARKAKGEQNEEDLAREVRVRKMIAAILGS